VLAGPEGQVHRYHKIHPFTFAGEPEHFSAGDRLVTVDVEGVRVTLFVCYDLRFADEFWATVEANLRAGRLRLVFLADAIPRELQRIVEASDKWDKRVCVLQVTDATERTVQLRALVSACDSGSAWDLRVYVREKLLEFLQREYPESLPRSFVIIAHPSARVVRKWPVPRARSAWCIMRETRTMEAASR
jgi:hypothetical protein